MAHRNRLLIVGNPERIHIGAHLLRSAQRLGAECTLCDVRQAYAAPALLTRLSWRLCDRKPPRLSAFELSVLQACKDFGPTKLLAIGAAPLSRDVLAKIGAMHIDRLGYLTDDPWNPVHYSRWFSAALREYDYLYTPRRANLAQLHEFTSATVAYVPFAYDPELHFRVSLSGAEERQRFDCDVLFFGGADSDRLPYVRKLVSTGMKVHLYGGYWNRVSDLRRYWKGHAEPSVLRKAVAGARITLCLVRRANRDGHVMRTFEAPAMGACMVTEATEEHYSILGADGDCTLYFHNSNEMIRRIEWLLSNPIEQARLRQAVYSHITQGPNTYTDRLSYMLS